MKRFPITSLTTAFAFCSAALVFAEAQPKITIEHNSNDEASSAFHFKTVPPPSEHDAGATAVLSLVDGSLDQNSGGLGCLNDGKRPNEDDQPAKNFFLNAGTSGGKVLFDLGKQIPVYQINTYSWHPAGRASQIYNVFAAEGSEPGFTTKMEKGADLQKLGWKEIAKVDTHSIHADQGGQYGVSIGAKESSIGNYRYILFDIAAGEKEDQFGNTFFSEIDIVDQNGEPTPALAQNESSGRKVISAAGGKYQITIDTSETPDLTEWAEKELAPVVEEWYPKMVAALPSDGYEAPEKLSIFFSKDMRGVAATGGTRIRCAADWFRSNLKGEAKGAVVHELVHVVQQYGRARRNNPDVTRTPGWIVEGIPDYLRWYRYEPNSHGADITARNISRARYDGSYRPSANFLNWVSTNYDKTLVVTLNSAAREGKYNEEIWKKSTGKSVEELGDEWKQQLQKKIASNESSGAPENATTGTGSDWKPLFNGKDFSGWHVFKTKGVRPGWQVQDGVLVCVDPHNAGDLCTDGEYDWFELELEYNISEGGNSGIMYHVTNKGRAAWATGPEFQLEDNKEAKDPQRCGWLYALYQPPIDPATGKPLDATKPAGEWNKVRLVISPEKCEHYINGVKYVEYNLKSDDFKSRVAKSKFGQMPNFAKFDKGFIALQGDHGQVKFRNIKIRSIASHD